MNAQRLPVMCAIAVTLATAAHGAQKPLRMVMIDAEGGAASLFVTPEGQSLLVDTGWGSGLPNARAGTNARPAGALPAATVDRIVAAAGRLGVKRIDYVLITHYHADHVGGVHDLLARMPVGTFIDHGANREELGAADAASAPPGHPANAYPRYVAAIANHRRRSVKAGETLSIGAMKLTFVASDGVMIDEPLAGAGDPTKHCDVGDKQAGLGGEENDRSLGFVVTYGQTRVLDLGDLTWQKEKELVCPVNKLGRVDLLLVSHHGSESSNSPPLLSAATPRIALVANGPRKGGDQSVFETLAALHPQPVVWQLHAATRSPGINRPEDYIANPDTPSDAAYGLGVSIYDDGGVQVTNMRNGYTERYP